MEFGVHGGTSGYIGEISDNVIGFNQWTVGGGAKYYFDPIDQQNRTWGIRLDYNFVNIEGDDSRSSNPADQERNLHFSNRIHELAAAAEFHFWEFRPLRGRNLMTPYVFAGVGMIRHNPKARVSGRNGRISLIDARVEPRKVSRDPTTGDITNVRLQHKYVMTIPFGAGFKYNLSGRLTPFSIGVELGYRYVFSDFVDGVGNSKHISYKDAYVNIDQEDRYIDDRATWEELARTYPDPNLSYDNLVATDNKRGARGNDYFMTATFRITYTLYKYRDPLW